jgi:hypothetical protein
VIWNWPWRRQSNRRPVPEANKRSFLRQSQGLSREVA